MLARRCLLPVLLATGCAAPDTSPQIYGAMREVLREGRDQGRVEVAAVTHSDSVGVGALAGLAGEVTILDGRAMVSRRVGDEIAVRDALPGEQAALLVTARVPAWRELPLPDLEDYDALEACVRDALLEAGLDPRAPTPLRITGRAERLQLHVIAGACPIATPDGPAPRRLDRPPDDVTLVGFYAEDAAGRLTHHTHSSHLHAHAGAVTGHLDEVQLRDARLFLPAK